MDPNQPLPSAQATGPVFSSPVQPVASQQGPSRGKRIVIVVAVLVITLLVIGAIVVMVLGTAKEDEPTATSKETNSTAGLQPATAVGVEQANNSISQDLGSMNDDEDLPADALDDKALGL